MKVQIERNGKVVETNCLTIELNNGTSFRISEERGELRINKIDFNDSQICISPCVSNEIKIK